MDKIWLILACFGLVFAIFALIAGFWLFRRIAQLVGEFEERISRLEGMLAAEEAAESERLSAAGKKGVQVREENREMRQSAMGEVRSMISAPGDLQGKLPQLAALVAKYPKVADEVADQAIREFHLEPYKDMIKGFIAVELQRLASGPTSSQSSGSWYGMP